MSKEPFCEVADQVGAQVDHERAMEIYDRHTLKPFLANKRFLMLHSEETTTGRHPLNPEG